MSAPLELVVDNGSVVSQHEVARDFSGASRFFRKTLSQLFQDVASGRKGFQAHSNVPHLNAEGHIARATKTDALGLYFATLFNTGKKSARELGPEKKLERLDQKCRSAAASAGSTNDNDVRAMANRITDFDRQRIWLKSFSAAQKAIELLGKVGTAVLPNGEEVHIVDVDNSFMEPNPDKPGIRELAIKIAVPITLADGTQTYHISEVQFWLEKTAADYKKSHEHFTLSRNAHDTQGTILLAMTKAKPETIPSLMKQWKNAGETRMVHMEERTRINLAIEAKLHIDENLKDNPSFKPQYANIGPLPGTAMQESIAAPRLAQA